MSRDGMNYTRIKNGEYNLPRGPAGSWDSGFIAVGYGINVPLRIGDTVRVYLWWSYFSSRYRSLARIRLHRDGRVARGWLGLPEPVTDGSGKLHNQHSVW